jgi:hypothetical protein
MSLASSKSLRLIFCKKQMHKEFQLQFLRELAPWTVALTLTAAKSKYRVAIGVEGFLRCCRLFLSRLNRKIYGHGTRRKSFRIASAAVIGHGLYGDNLHIHWVLAGPPEMPTDSFKELVRLIILTNKGLGQQFNIQTYYGQFWLLYMLDHGFEGVITDLTFQAKYPVH